jgi:hypothetical protein
MNVNLNYEQRARLELIASYSGRSAEKVLIDTAEFLLNCEADYYPPMPPPQQFIPEEDLEIRLNQLLRR